MLSNFENCSNLKFDKCISPVIGVIKKKKKDLNGQKKCRFSNLLEAHDMPTVKIIFVLF